jgi:hypothetical protein
MERGLRINQHVEVSTIWGMLCSSDYGLIKPSVRRNQESELGFNSGELQNRVHQCSVPSAVVSLL